MITNVEENPAQVVEFEHLERVGKTGYGLLDGVAVLANDRFASRLYLGDDGEAVTGGSAWIGWTVSAILDGEVSLFRNRHSSGFGPVGFFGGCDCFCCCHFVSFETRKIFMRENYRKLRRAETR
jgi:hypothetical protein